MRYKASQPEDTKIGTKFNMFDLKLNADSSNIKFFDVKLNEGILKDSLNFKKYIPNDSTVTPGLQIEEFNSKIPDIKKEIKLKEEEYNQIKNDTLRLKEFNQFDKDSLNRKVRK